MGTEAIAAIVASLVATGASFSLIGELVNRLLHKTRPSASRAENIQQRAERLNSVLGEAVTLISEVEEQIETGQRRALELQEEIERNKHIAALTEEQTKALRLMLGETIDHDRRRSFWQSVILNFVFFVLGVGSTILVTLYFA